MSKESKKDKIIVMGDVHGCFGELNTFLNKRRYKMILQVGDFGYYPKWTNKGKLEKTPKSPDTKIHFCDGNHEDHWALRDRKQDELYPNVFYQPRGSYITLDDGRNVLFMGGAQSIDKDYRVFGRDWFPEETIIDSDLDNLPDVTIDILICHTCPGIFQDAMIEHSSFSDKIADPSCMALNFVIDKYHPKLIYFGHWHYYSKGIYSWPNGDYCEWTCLDMLHGRGPYWEELAGPQEDYTC